MHRRNYLYAGVSAGTVPCQRHRVGDLSAGGRGRGNEAGGWPGSCPGRGWAQRATRTCHGNVLRHFGGASERSKVTTLEEGVGPDAEGTGGGQTHTEGASPQAPHGWRAAAPDLPGLVRRHWIFAVALGVAVLPRLVAIIGFQPAVLFRLDTYDYLWGAVRLSPNVVNPSGYSV